MADIPKGIRGVDWYSKRRQAAQAPIRGTQLAVTPASNPGLICGRQLDGSVEVGGLGGIPILPGSIDPGSMQGHAYIAPTYQGGSFSASASTNLQGLSQDVQTQILLNNVPQDAGATRILWLFRKTGTTNWTPWAETTLAGIPHPPASQLVSFGYGQLSNGVAYDFGLAYVSLRGDVGAISAFATNYVVSPIVITTPYLIGTTSPTPTVTTVTVTNQTSANGVAAAVRLQFTLTNQPTDGSLSRLSIFFRVTGSTAWTFYASIGVPGLPTPSAVQAYDETLADLTNGQNYDFACAYENAQGQDSATLGIIYTNWPAQALNLPTSSLPGAPAGSSLAISAVSLGTYVGTDGAAGYQPVTFTPTVTSTPAFSAWGAGYLLWAKVNDTGVVDGDTNVNNYVPAGSLSTNTTGTPVTTQFGPLGAGHAWQFAIQYVDQRKVAGILSIVGTMVVPQKVGRPTFLDYIVTPTVTGDSYTTRASGKGTEQQTTVTFKITNYSTLPAPSGLDHILLLSYLEGATNPSQQWSIDPASGTAGGGGVTYTRSITCPVGSTIALKVAFVGIDGKMSPITVLPNCATVTDPNGDFVDPGDPNNGIKHGRTSPPTRNVITATPDTDGTYLTHGQVHSTHLVTGHTGNEIDIDAIPDGRATYGRPILTRLSGGKPLIDPSESIHIGGALTDSGSQRLLYGRLHKLLTDAFVSDGTLNASNANIAPNADLAIGGGLNGIGGLNTGTVPKYYFAYNNGVATEACSFAYDSVAGCPGGGGAWQLQFTTNTTTKGIAFGSSWDGYTQTLKAGATYICSYYAETDNTSAITVTLASNAGVTLAALPAFTTTLTPGAWQRFAFSVVVGAADYTGGLFPNTPSPLAAGKSFFIGGIKLEEGSVLSTWSPSVNVDLDSQTRGILGYAKHAPVFKNIVDSSGQGHQTQFDGVVVADPTSALAGYHITLQNLHWDKAATTHDLANGPLFYRMTGYTSASGQEFAVAFLCDTNTSNTEPTNGYLVQWSGSDVYIYQRVAGTYNALRTGIPVPNNSSTVGDHVFEVGVYGKGTTADPVRICVTCDGSDPVTVAVPVAGSRTSGYFGIRSTGTQTRFHDFRFGQSSVVSPPGTRNLLKNGMFLQGGSPLLGSDYGWTAYGAAVDALSGTYTTNGKTYTVSRIQNGTTSQGLYQQIQVTPGQWYSYALLMDFDAANPQLCRVYMDANALGGPEITAVQPIQGEIPSFYSGATVVSLDGINVPTGNAWCLVSGSFKVPTNVSTIWFLGQGFSGVAGSQFWTTGAMFWQGTSWQDYVDGDPLAGGIDLPIHVGKRALPLINHDSTVIDAKTRTLAAIDSGGIVVAAGMDFSRAYTGMGALARKSQAALATDVTGTLPYANQSTEYAGNFDSSGNLKASTTMTAKIPNSTAFVTDFTIYYTFTLGTIGVADSNMSIGYNNGTVGSDATVWLPDGTTINIGHADGSTGHAFIYDDTTSLYSSAGSHDKYYVFAYWNQSTSSMSFNVSKNTPYTLSAVKVAYADGGYIVALATASGTAPANAQGVSGGGSYTPPGRGLN